MYLLCNLTDPTGNGGNSDTGNLAKAFFSEKNREAVCDLFHFEDDEMRNKYAKLHQNCCVTLRVMNSTETIDVQALEAHNIETNVLALEIFPWMEWLDLYLIFCLNFRILRDHP